MSTIDKEKESQRESLRHMDTDQLIVDVCTPSKEEEVEEELENDLGDNENESSPNPKGPSVQFQKNLVKT